jgi:hypothetical protein
MIIGQQLKAQKSKCCYVSHYGKVQPPKFVDSALFISDLKNKLDLKSVYDLFKKNSMLGTFLYTFEINKLGKIVPKLYYDKDDIGTKKIQLFVEQVFNYYKWEPAYRKNCNDCKIGYYLQLSVWLRMDEKKVIVFINNAKTLKKIFYREIPYKALR